MLCVRIQNGVLKFEFECSILVIYYLTVSLEGSFVSGSVVNLSKKVLSEADINLLSKGLKFSPTATDINKAELKEDLDVFKRRIRLKW